MTRHWIGWVLVLLLAGCAGTVPKEVRDAPDDPVSLSAVLDNPQRYDGEAVRWGGEIAEIRNEERATWVEIVERPLQRSGQPRGADQSEGRFLARIEGFLEPTTYAPGRRVTVAGTLDGSVDGQIGEYRYSYPVVAVRAHHLWTERQVSPAPRRHYDPWACDPWYDPWYDGPRDPWCRPYRRPYW